MLFPKILKLNQLNRERLSAKETFNIAALLIYNFLFADTIAGFFQTDSHTKTFASIGWTGVLSALILAPVIEEFVFRKGLSGKPQDLKYVVIMPIPLMFLNFWLGLVIWLSLLLYFFGGQNKNFNVPLKGHLYNVLVFSSAVIFSIMHVITIDDIDSILIKIMLCLVAFLPTALYLTYVRVRYGFIYAILAHALLNGIALSLNSVIYF
jgi:hypothetical protein